MSPRLSILLLLAAFVARLPRVHAQQPNDKAARVLEPLLKRPGSGPLFDRFVNAWLDSATLEELGKYLTQRVTAEPSTPNRLLLALFHSRQGEPVKALEQFRAALASDPGSPDIWYQKALLESRTLDFESAMASLGKCLALNPPGELPLQAAQLLGRLQARAGRTEEALQTWRALMESRPGDDELREDILELQMAGSLWPAARETAETLVERTADPYRRVLRRMRLGDVLDRSGQRDKALETFAACLTDTGAGSWLEKEILSQIEKLFRREDDLSGLRACFTKLLEKHAHRAGLQRAQARLLMEAGETEAAIACGRALMALSPGDRAVREEFIALLTGAGRAGEAIPQVVQLLVQMPDDLELLLTLADLRHTARDLPGALAALRDYEQRAAANEGAALRIAGLMDRYGLAGEAEKTLRAALERQDQPELRQMLASLLHKSGRKEEALAEWNRLAAGASLSQVQQTARVMQAHGESAAAWQIMQAAAPQAERDPVFLTHFCTLADEPERALAALPSARRLVELARSASDLSNALDVGQRVARLSGRAEEFTAELTRSAATAQALCFLATLREAARDTIGASAALEKARAVAPDLAQAQLVRLWTLRGDFAQAAAAAETLFNSPGGRQGHIAEMLASLHQRAGSAEAALRWTQEWRRLVPGAATPVLAEARLLESLGRGTEALTALRSAAARFESNEDIRARLASLSLDTGRTAEALRIYSSLYEEAADLSAKMRWLGRWGEAAEDAGQLDNLIAQFEDRRRENRGSVAPLMALAELHRIADNYDARRNALTGAARLKPDDPEIALEIARLEARENDEESAIRTLRPLLPKDSSGRVASLLADLLINSGRLDEGIRLLTERTASSAGAVELAALALARRDEEKTALTFLQTHLTKFPGDGRLQFLAGLIEWRTGNHEAAVARLLPLSTATVPPARSGGLTVSGASGQTYDEMVLRLMPPDVQRLFRLLLASAALNAPNNNSWPGSGRQSPYTSLPVSLEELQDRSAALILEMAKSAAPGKQVVWTEELERRGFTAARLVTDLPPLRRLQPADRTFDFTALLEQHPDNRPLLALAALATAYRQWTMPADAVMAEKVWAAFKADAPPAALFLALPGAGGGENPAAWEEQVLAAAEKLDDPPALLLLAAMRSGGLMSRSEDYVDDPPVPDAWRQRVARLLERWRAAGDGTARGYAASLHGAAFTGLAQEYVRTKAAAPLAALLESEWNRQAAGGQPASSSNSREELAQPLGFPPWFLPGLPDRLRGFVQRSLTAETTALVLPLVQDPLLRVLLAAKVPGDAVETAMHALPPSGATGATPYILAASWAEKRGDYAAAGEQAVKALYLPVSQEVRRRLDGALAYWASKKGKPGDALHTAGREAALRLRRDAVTEERRAELARLLDKLGLTEEADRLMRQGKAAGAAQASTPDEKLDRLLDDGRNKEALPPLLSEIRTWARQRLNTSGEPSRDALTKWRTRVQANGLLPQVMQALLPPQATPQQMAEYAAACDLTNDIARAREFYERALAAGVVKNVPLRLMRIVARMDQDRALDLVRSHPALFTDEQLRAWMRELAFDADRTMTIEECLNVARFFERALELPASFYDGRFPAAAVLEMAGGEARAGDFYTLSEVDEGNKLQSRLSDPPEAETVRVKALAAGRMAAYDRLVRAYATMPGIAMDIWYQLVRALSVQGRPREELLAMEMKMAVEVMELEQPQKSGGMTAAQLGGVLATLMQHAAECGRAADFAREIVPVVRRRFDPAVQEQLLENWPLYETTPEEFAATARRFIERQGAQAWGAIIGTAALRRCGGDLAPDLLAHYSRPGPKAKDDNVDSFGTWCTALERMQGRAAAERFFQEVVQSLLGPVAERAASLKDVKSPRLLSALRLMGNLAQEESWTGFVMRWLRAEFVPHATEAVQEMVSGHFHERTISAVLYRLTGEEKLVEAKAYLDALPVTGDIDTFYGGSGEAITNAARAVQNLNEKKRAALGLGGNDGSLTFGRRVLRGAANGWMSGVCEELAGWEQRIADLPEPQGSLVQEQLRRIEGELEFDASPGARAFYNWLHREQLEKEKAELELNLTKFLKDAEEEKFGSVEELMERLNRILSTMAGQTHPRGREVMSAARRAMAELETGDTSSPLLNALMESGDDYRRSRHQHVAAWITGLMAGAIREGEPAAEALERGLGGIGTALLESADTPVEGRLAAFMDRLGPCLQPGEARLIVVWVLGNLGGIYNWRESEKRYAEGVRWAESQRGKCAHEELRLEMEMALRFHLSRWKDSAPGVTAESSLPPEQRHYLGMLRDATLPEPPRLTFGAALLDNDGVSTLEPLLVHETARLLQRALAARQPVTPGQEAYVFTALALLPPAARDGGLIKSLLPLTSLPRLRGDSEDYEIATGLVALLDLALQAGDTATADRLLEMEGKFPGQGAITVLARHGQKQRLADLLKHRPEVLQNGQDACIPNDWDAALQSQLPAVLETIADPVVRFETLVLLMLQNDADPVPPGLKPRAVRVDELTAAFSSVPWRGTGVRDRVLDSCLLRDASPPESLLPALREAVERVPLAALPFVEADRYRGWTEFSAVLVSRPLIEGDAKPLRDALRQLFAVPRADRNVIGGLLETILDYQHNEVLRAWPKLTPEVRAGLCMSWLRVTEEMNDASWRPAWTEELKFTLLLHAMAGRMEELKAWHAAQPETHQAVMRRWLENQAPLDLLQHPPVDKDMTGSPEERSRRRLALFTALVVNPLGCGPGVQFDGDFFSQGGTPEEFLTLEQPLSSARPEDGWLAAAFARVHAAAGAWDKVLARTDAALAKVKPERGTSYAPLLELRVQALEHTGRGAEALPEIRALPALPPAGAFGDARDLTRAAQARLLRRVEGVTPPVK